MADEKVDAYVCDAIKERLALLRILEQPRFGLLEGLGPTSLNHVREERPRRAAESDEWDLTAEPVPRTRDSSKDILKFLLHVDVLAQARDVCRRIERSGEGGGGIHEDLHAHGLRHDENVAEDDGGVDEARVPPYRLKRDLARKRRRPTYLKKLVLCTDGTEFCSSGISGLRLIRGCEFTCPEGSVRPDASPRRGRARFLHLGSEVR